MPVRWLVLVACCSCNWAFGVRSAVEGDAADGATVFFDRPADAPFACPQIGGAPPRFDPTIHLVSQQDCQSYTLSTPTNRALALCLESSVEYIEEGALDAPLTHAIGFPDPSVAVITSPTLVPEGNAAIVHRHTVATNLDEKVLYTRDDTTSTWSDSGTLPFVATDLTSNVTLGPTRHALEQTPSGLNPIIEWVYDADVWSYKNSDMVALGASIIDSMRLSPDGLRLLFYGSTIDGQTTGVLYLDRADIDSLTWNTPPHLVTGVSGADFFMTEDCGRIYVSSVNGFGYVERL